MPAADVGPRRSYACDWTATVCTVSVLVVDRVLERGEQMALHWVGIGCLLLGGVLFFLPMLALRRHGRVAIGGSYMDTTVVVDRGLFGIVRHPQYLGYMGLNLGFMLLSQRWPVLVLGVAAVVLFYGAALAEERMLRRQYGEPYVQYCRRVPRFNFALGLVRKMTRGA